MGCFNSKSKKKDKNDKNEPGSPAAVTYPAGGNSASSSQLATNKQFISEAFEAHNKFRGAHNAVKLKLNQDLCATAQQWAEHIAKSNNFEHSNNSYMQQSLGENIAMRYTSTGEELTGRQMTDQWYEEANNYNYGEDFQQGKGHFAQIVWGNTREVGFGRAKAADGKWYAVANYFPAGNYIGQFRENVKPPRVDRL